MRTSGTAAIGLALAVAAPAGADERVEQTDAPAAEAGATSRAARAICFFNPLHGHAAGKVTWQRGLRVPACGECTTALRRSEAPDALMRG